MLRDGRGFVHGPTESKADMEILFRRHFWIAHVLFTGIVAFLLARTTTDVAGHMLREAFEQQTKKKPTARAPMRGEKRDFDALSDANIFDGKREIVTALDPSMIPCTTDADCTAPMKCQAVEGGPETIGQKTCQVPAQVAPLDFANAQKSDLPLKLVGTSVFWTPEDSLASIEETSNKGVALLYSINQCGPPVEPPPPVDGEDLSNLVPEPTPCRDLPGGHTVVRIDVDRVYLLNADQNRYEYIALDEPPGTGKIAMKPAVTAKIEKNDEAGGDPSAGITKTGENSFEVTQSAVNDALGNLSSLATQARIVPAFEGGQAVGFKLFSIRPGSLYSKIGIQNGDIIQKVNGYEISSPDKALEVYQKLKDGKAFSVDIKRRGKPVTLDYSISQ